METYIYKNLLYTLVTTEEPGHCSECRDHIKSGSKAFQHDSIAKPKICCECVTNLIKMAEFREEFHKRLQKHGWFDL